MSNQVGIVGGLVVRGVGKVVAAAVAAIAVPFSVVATAPGVAQAAPCVGAGANPGSCHDCLYLVAQYHAGTPSVCFDAAPPRRAQAPVSRAPVQIPEAPPELAPPINASPSPEPVQTEQIFPPSVPVPSTIPVQSPQTSPVPVSASKETARPSVPWWPSALGYGGLVIAVGIFAWVIERRKRSADISASP